MEKIIDLNKEKIARIELLMELLGYKTVKEFAKAIKVSPSYLSEMLSGKKNISKILGQHIEDNLLVSRKWFDTGDGDIWLVNDDERQKIEPLSVLRKPNRVPGRYAWDIRFANDLSHAEFAEALGVTEEEVRKHERSTVIHDEDYIIKVRDFVIKINGLDQERDPEQPNWQWPMWVCLAYTGLTPEQFSEKVGIDIDQIDRAIMRGNRANFTTEQVKRFMSLPKAEDFSSSDKGPSTEILNLVQERRKQYNQNRDLVDYNSAFPNTINLRGKYVVFANLIRAIAPEVPLEREDIYTPTEEMDGHAVTMTIPPVGKFLSVQITGENMENYTNPELAKQSIPDGSIVTGRDVPKKYWSERQHMNKMRDLIFILPNQVWINRIKGYKYSEEEGGIFTLESLNPDKEKYPDFDAPIKYIRHILYIFKKEPPNH